MGVVLVAGVEVFLAVSLAFVGFIHLLIAATAMLGSSLTVIGNSTRAARRH